MAGWLDEGERLRARVRTKLDKAHKAGREPTGLTDPSRIPLYPWEEAPLLTGSQRTAALRRPDGQLPLTPDGAFIRAFLPASDTWEVLRPVASTSAGPSGAGGGKGPLGSLYAAAAMLRGSADLQAQLLVALLRALDIPARLVVSLQAMEWRSKSQSGAAPKRGGGGGGTGAKGRGSGKGKGRAAAGASTDEDTGSAASASAAARRKPPVGKAVKGLKKASAPETLVLSSTASEGETGSGSAGGRSAGGTRRKGPSAGGGWVDGQGKMAYKVPKVNLRRSSGPSVKVPGWKKEEELRRGASPGASSSLPSPSFPRAL